MSHPAHQTEPATQIEAEIEAAPDAEPEIEPTNPGALAAASEDNDSDATPRPPSANTHPDAEEAAAAAAAARSLVTAAELAAAEEVLLSHPLNPASEMHIRAIDHKSLSEVCGLRRLGVHLVRVPPGKESAIYHVHQGEEEFLYILSGHGVAEIGEEEHAIGPGDFMGFAPGVAHHLRNTSAEDLVYLMAGERNELEIADFPRQKKRLVRVGQEAQVVDWDSLRPLWRYG